MEFKDTKSHLDKNEINDLTELLKSNLDKNNIKHSEINISNLSNIVNNNKYGFTFNCKGLFSGTISLTFRNNKHLNKINKIQSDFSILANRFVSNYCQSEKKVSSQNLIGISQHIIDIENFINLAKTNIKPVLIEGQNGGEQLTIASSIHVNSVLNEGELYELNCNKLSVYKDPLNYIDKLMDIKIGTLYISSIDILNKEQQYKLLSCLERLEPNVRVITSSTRGLENLVQLDQFHPALYRFISILQIRLPTLKERLEDIPHILRSIVKKQGENKKFSNESIELFKNYDWPNNYAELNNIALNLIRSSKNKTISLSDIENYAPFMLAGRKSIIDHQKLMSCLINKDFSCLDTLHPSLRKSLNYIANNYEQEISLDRLADKSHISPSHLSYLFRSNFGISFKIIISKFRVEMIKKYFLNHPEKSITESALDNGFGDLSHFEKIFKKYTGMTPKKYKLLELKKY